MSTIKIRRVNLYYGYIEIFPYSLIKLNKLAIKNSVWLS